VFFYAKYWEYIDKKVDFQYYCNAMPNQYSKGPGSRGRFSSGSRPKGGSFSRGGNSAGQTAGTTRGPSFNRNSSYNKHTSFSRSTSQVGTSAGRSSSSFHSRPAGKSFGGSRPFNRGGFNRGGGRGGNRGPQGAHIDISKFINKAVITEQVVHFVPEHQFVDFQIQEILKKNIVAKGYTTPTPIQDRSIPHILRGEDVVGIANTGTGKTGAFLIPLINKILLNPAERVLIMVPTRELAIQIADEFRGFSKNLRMSTAVCVGGASIHMQIQDLRRRPAFVIGTPGRLKDLLERKQLILTGFKSVVLDEADRMLDMGFINDMRAILKLLTTPRHTLFFSATLSTEIERLIGEFLREPIRISV